LSRTSTTDAIVSEPIRPIDGSSAHYRDILEEGTVYPFLLSQAVVSPMRAHRSGAIVIATSATSFNPITGHGTHQSPCRAHCENTTHRLDQLTRYREVKLRRVDRACSFEVCLRRFESLGGGIHSSLSPQRFAAGPAEVSRRFLIGWRSARF
jgi:hypothetical protein